jgi:hypothetical protein
MKRPKGPELKLPALKVPPALADLFYDLRDRRLLPLIALIAVAIIAVPFLLGNSSEKLARGPSAAAGVGGSSVTGAEPDTASLTVVRAKPGLREYHKRLKRRSPTNPFKQRYTGAVNKGEKTSTSETSSSSSETVTSTSTTTTSTGTRKGGIVFFAFAINVKIVKVPGKGAEATTQTPEPVTKDKVLPQTPIPGEKTPVVTYMGPSRKPSKGGEGRVLLLVSDNVRSVYGEGKCISGGEVCQLLEVEPGFPEEFVYGANEVVYRITVLKIVPVVTGHT